MRVSVDLARCQSYGQCVFFAPDVFELRDREVLEFDGAPDPDAWAGLVRARSACPVQAITLGPASGSAGSADDLQGAADVDDA